MLFPSFWFFSCAATVQLQVKMRCFWGIFHPQNSCLQWVSQMEEHSRQPMKNNHSVTKRANKNSYQKLSTRMSKQERRRSEDKAETTCGTMRGLKELRSFTEALADLRYKSSKTSSEDWTTPGTVWLWSCGQTVVTHTVLHFPICTSCVVSQPRFPLL